VTDDIVAPVPPAVALIDITKRFGSVVALNAARLIVRPGTVHALLGENGAGKTTLMRVAFGMIRPDGGRVTAFGREAHWRSSADAMAAGIGMVHQHFTLVPAMSVTENVELGAPDVAMSHRGFYARWRFDRRAAGERVRVLGRASGLAVDPDASVAELSVAAQQRVEIIKALRRDARVLILDEPTAVLAPGEIKEILRWLRAYADSGGTAILITHKLREALLVADEVTVLHRGRTVLSVPRREVDEESLARAMIGDDRITQPADKLAATRSVGRQSGAHPDSPVVVLENVDAMDTAGRERIHKAKLTVGAGEIVGVVGVEGAGQHTLLRVMAGRVLPTSGRVTLPTDIGFIPEDRQQDGLVLDFSLTENVMLRGAGRRRGRLSWKAARTRTSALMRDFDIRASSPAVHVSTLSGGNQQRLILSRELDGKPALIIAENPTRGLDIRSATGVLDRLRAAGDGGTAIVFYSSDLDEVLALSSRIFAVHSGSIREVVAEREAIGRAMLGLP
jgi:simple sugar transport system ATP-binding protein